VGSGLNGTVLHYSDDSGPINTGDLVVIDAAGEVLIQRPAVQILAMRFDIFPRYRI